MLTGKYLNPEQPVPNARLNKFDGFMGRYRNEESVEACTQYAQIAEMVRDAWLYGGRRRRAGGRGRARLACAGSSTFDFDFFPRVINAAKSGRYLFCAPVGRTRLLFVVLVVCF